MDTMNAIESIKEHFRHADTETREQIASLERNVKRAKLYVNLSEHDAVKMILEFCDARYASLSKFLEEQSAESLATEADRLKRARYEAYRDAFAWFRKLFTIQRAKAESGEARVAEIAGRIEPKK